MTFSRGRLVCTVFAAVFFVTTQSGVAFNSNSIILPAGATLVVELTKSIDAKKARPGDEVSAKLIQDFIANGHVIFPRGSKLQGHISEVKAYSKEERESVLGVVFDKLVLKNGVEIPLRAVVQALAPPRDEFFDGESSAYGGRRASGGQPVNSSPEPFGDPRNVRDHTRDNALENAANPSSYGIAANRHPAGWLDPGAHGVFGIPGLALKPPLVLSTTANVKLEGRVQMVLVELHTRKNKLTTDSTEELISTDWAAGAALYLVAVGDSGESNSSSGREFCPHATDAAGDCACVCSVSGGISRLPREGP